MPPKRKDTVAATPAAAGPKPKRSKPTFQTARVAATATSEDPGPSQTSSSKSRVVTLRPSASGRRGYQTREQSTTPNSNPGSSSAPDSTFASDVPDTCDTIPPTAEPTIANPDSDGHPALNAGSRAKQKNTTTVCDLLLI